MKNLMEIQNLYGDFNLDLAVTLDQILIRAPLPPQDMPSADHTNVTSTRKSIN